MPIFLSPDMPPPRSIILCTTPRSGSTLLCALLASTGVAGRPESWFRAQDRAHYARQWGLPVNPAPAAYLVAAITAGQSPNGTCGLRLQIPSLAPFLVELRTLFGTKPDQELITLALGPAHFLWVRRRDTVAQAVSRLKAETSQVWHQDGTEAPPLAIPTYDAAKIAAFVTDATEGNQAWASWFAAQHIFPHQLVYEDFAPNPARSVAGLLRRLNIALPKGTRIEAPNCRMADATSAAWIARFQAETALPREIQNLTDC